MSFVRTVPSSVAELHKYLLKIYEGRSHIRSAIVNPATGHLEVALDGMAHFAGNSDVFLPIKKGKIQEASERIDKIMREAQLGHRPTDTDAQALFELVDPLGQ